MYESVSSGRQAELPDLHGVEDCYVDAPVGVRYAAAFRARSPLLVAGPTVFLQARFG